MKTNVLKGASCLLAASILTTSTTAQSLEDKFNGWKPTQQSIQEYNALSTEWKLVSNLLQTVFNTSSTTAPHKDKSVRQPVTKNTPLVQVHNDRWGRGWDWAWENLNKDNLGLRFEMIAAMGMGYSTPIWSEVADDMFGTVRFSPDFEIDLSGDLAVEVHLWIADFVIRLNVEGYNFTPFDFLFWIDPFNPKRYCYGMEYYTRGLRLFVEIEQSIDECHFGAFGILNSDPLDCVWRTYKPFPVYELQATDVLDVSGDYFKFKCMNWFSAEWENWDYDINGPTSVVAPATQPEEVDEGAEVQPQDEPSNIDN